MTKTNLLVLLITMFIAAETAYSQYGSTSESTINPEVMRIDETAHLGTPVSGDYVFIDERGDEFVMADMFGKPLMIVLSYYACDGICPTSNMNLVKTLDEVERYRLGEDYRVLTVSFDKDDDVQKMRMFTDMLANRIDPGTDLPGNDPEEGRWGGHDKGWRIALMNNSEDIARLTGSTGFKFFWSPRDRMFLHPNVVIFLSPKGRVVRYLYGTPLAGKDVELAISEAYYGRTSKTRIIDLVNMACYSYNFKEGRYTLNYPLFIGFGSLIFGVTFIAAPIYIIRRKKEAQS